MTSSTSPNHSAHSANQRAASPSWRIVLMSVLAVVLATVLAACTSIPTSGPVGTYAPEDKDGNEHSYTFDVPGPSPGDSPETIVRGFLAAGVSAQDDWAVARSFLTAERSPQWNPTKEVIVTDSTPSVNRSEEGQGTLVAKPRVLRTVDAYGVQNENPNPQTRTLEFELLKENGEWRISRAPDGVVVESQMFQRAYESVTLAFYNPQLTAVVPDVRWFARRQGMATAVVTALLHGPAPYLEGSVTSAFPKDAGLARPTVPVQDGLAQVDVPEEVVSSADDRQRSLMMRQLDLSLSEVPSVQKVSMSVDQQELKVSADAERNPPVVEPQVSDKLVGLQNDLLVRANESGNRLVDVQSTLGPGLSSPAMQPGSDVVYAVLAAQKTRLLSVDGSTGSFRELQTGPVMTAPSMDGFGWVWTSDADGVVAYDSESGKSARMDLDLKPNSTVTSVRVSPDGARLAFTLTDAEGERLLVSGIQRSKSDRPTGLAKPLKVKTTSKPTRVQWIGASDLVVYKPDPKSRVDVEQVSLLGETKMWRQPLLGMTHLTVGAGQDAVYAENADGVYQRTSNGWKQVRRDDHELSYAG